MSRQGLPVGHVRGSGEVRAAVQPCHTTRRAPAMTAAVAGGKWPGNGSPPSGFSPCADSFALRPVGWRGGMQGSFLRCDLEEEKRSKFVFPFEINFISPSAWDRV